MKKGKIYEVSCKFYVRANDHIDVEQFCKEEDNFIEKHILVMPIIDEKQVSFIEHNKDIWKDLTKK